MLAWKKTQRLLTLAFVLALLLCCVPALAVPAAAADTEMYLYNGVELSDINSVWTDKETYPYAGISVGDTSYLAASLGLDINVPMYALALFNLKPYLKDSDTLAFSANWSASYYYLIRDANACDSLNAALGRTLFIPATWVLGEVSSNNDYEKYVLGTEGFVWSSVDILDVNGTICFAASEPVRVTTSSSISSVSILSPDIVQAGLSIVASVDVAGTGDFDSSATLTLSGNASSGTYLKKGAYGNNWLLYCGSDESASKLTLTAASVQDPSVTAIKTITVGQSGVDSTDPTIPEGEAPMPTEENPTEPGDDIGGGSSDDEKDEATDEGSEGVGELTDAIPDYSEGFMAALQDFASAMSYTGTEAKLKIPAVMVPSLGDLVPGFQMMEEMELDFGAYVRMMPGGLMTLAQSLLTIALIVYCFKELYDTISYFLTLKGGSA